MSKFKKGDRIRRVVGSGLGGGGRKHSAGDIVVFDHYDKRDVVGDIIVDEVGSRGYAYQYELVSQPTGFEVGKTYQHKSFPSSIYTVLYVGKESVFFTSVNGHESILSISNYKFYKEYIPSPPEEWRIVYKDEFGVVVIGVTPFKSDSEARSSAWWDNHSFKTIRVDA